MTTLFHPFYLSILQCVSSHGSKTSSAFASTWIHQLVSNSDLFVLLLYSGQLLFDKSSRKLHDRFMQQRYCLHQWMYQSISDLFIGHCQWYLRSERSGTFFLDQQFSFCSCLLDPFEIKFHDQWSMLSARFICNNERPSCSFLLLISIWN